MFSNLNLEELLQLQKELENCIREKSSETYNIFAIKSNREFGEKWSYEYLSKFCDLSKSFDNSYDYNYKDLKIEIKAARRHETSDKFNFNFQHTKPICCDLFIMVGVLEDCIKLWIIPSKTLKRIPFYCHTQHRFNPEEGQLSITEKKVDFLKEFEVDGEWLDATLEFYCEDGRKLLQ